MGAEDYLRSIMAKYTTANLDGITPEAFKRKIDAFLSLDDWEMEGYHSPDKQRDKSIKFEWGHNHDFGTFKVDGAMGDRHIGVMAEFIDNWGLPRDLTGKYVWDIGAWCGGISLLLAGMGAVVDADEEVAKYADVIGFLRECFKLNIAVSHASLYDEDGESQYDYIICAGVLYHVTDPIVALRIMFNALKDGGVLFLETMGYAGDMGESTLRYHGSGRDGWNWFEPSSGALMFMLQDVGFDCTSTITKKNGRIYTKAVRVEHREMLRAGLSRRDIR